MKTNYQAIRPFETKILVYEMTVLSMYMRMLVSVIFQFRCSASKTQGDVISDQRISRCGRFHAVMQLFFVGSGR